MAKFYGQVGYAESVETTPGVWEEQIVERDYCGDLIKNNRLRNCLFNRLAWVKRRKRILKDQLHIFSCVT